jgi:hypothetical protein
MNWWLSLILVIQLILFTVSTKGHGLLSGVVCESMNVSYCYSMAGSLPGTMAAHSLMSAIKNKCTPDEAAQLLRDLPNKFPNGEDNGRCFTIAALLQQHCGHLSIRSDHWNHNIHTFLVCMLQIALEIQVIP